MRFWRGPLGRPVCPWRFVCGGEIASVLWQGCAPQAAWSLPSGIYANAIHTDITNHYLMMGVYGGLPLMLLFLWVIFAAFGIVGKALLLNHNAPMERQFLIWTLGAILVAHVTNFISISYFDQ